MPHNGMPYGYSSAATYAYTCGVCICLHARHMCAYTCGMHAVGAYARYGTAKLASLAFSAELSRRRRHRGVP